MSNRGRALARVGRGTVEAVLAVVSLCFAVVGCVDKEKCDEAVRVTRDALAKEQPDIARQWRDRAWKICNDATATSALDKEIVDKEAELSKRAADMQKQVAEAAQQRMNAATAVWKAFDHLDDKHRTVDALGEHKARAERASRGLPPEYGKQIDEYNEHEYARRRGTVAAAEKK